MKNLGQIVNDKDIVTKDYIPEDKIFWATYGTTTSAELVTAYQSGKLICVEYQDDVYILTFEYNEDDLSVYEFHSVGGITSKGISCIDDDWSTGEVSLQRQLVSGANIKTINNESILGSGNITVSGGGTTVKIVRW